MNMSAELSIGTSLRVVSMKEAWVSFGDVGLRGGFGSAKLDEALGDEEDVTVVPQQSLNTTTLASQVRQPNSVQCTL